MSWRRFGVLISQLPNDSALARAEIGPAGVWSIEAHILAGLLDAVNAGNWQRGNAGARTKTPKPKRIPRPGVETGGMDGRTIGAGKGMSVAEFDEMYDRIMADGLTLEEVDITDGS